MLQLGHYHHTTVPEKEITVLIPILPRSQRGKSGTEGILKGREAEEIRGKRPFPSSKNSHFQNEYKTFLVIMSFTCMRIKKNLFHINGFALSLPWSNSEMAYYATLLNKGWKGGSQEKGRELRIQGVRGGRFGPHKPPPPPPPPQCTNKEQIHLFYIIYDV